MKNVVSTTRPLELLHMDLFDPSKTTSLGGNYYALVIVDDFSRLTWTLFLESKSDTFSKIKKPAKMLQNKNCSTICVICSDHGGEFQNKKFNCFCEKMGILHNLSTPRTLKKWGCRKEK